MLGGALAVEGAQHTTLKQSAAAPRERNDDLGTMQALPEAQHHKVP